MKGGRTNLNNRQTVTNPHWNGKAAWGCFGAGESRAVSRVLPRGLAKPLELKFEPAEISDRVKDAKRLGGCRPSVED